jgi:branched-chain amino acid transport system permease protein
MSVEIKTKANLVDVLVWLILPVLLLSLPLFGSPFVLTQLGAQTLALGTIAMSLSFLAGQLGMVSLLQMSLAGVAAYAMAMSGHASAGLGWGWPLWLCILFALGSTLLVSLAVGALSARTEGVYTIMITLALGIAFVNLATQNYVLFNGFDGFTRVQVPVLAPESWGKESNLYLICLLLAVIAGLLVFWIRQTTLGMAFNGVRDNPRRMQSMGYSVLGLRIVAFGIAGMVAAIGGVAMVWYDQMITPGRINVFAMIEVLIVAVMGGIRQPQGAYFGAFAYILLRTFAIDFVGPERFNLLIGMVFIAIVMFSDDGLTGWVKRARKRKLPSGKIEKE